MGEMSEKLCLKWNDFHENVNTAFGRLRDDNDFSDITLASEDGQQMEAHRVILSASSPFFKSLLYKNKHPHPLIYMRGVKSEDLIAIVDFLYCGEANVYQENIESFLALAEELDLKGLSDNGGSSKIEEPNHVIEDTTKQETNQIQQHREVTKQYKNQTQESDTAERTVSATTFDLSGEILELDKKVKSMIGKTKNRIPQGKKMAFASVCTLCGKEGLNHQIKNHIERKHLEGISIPCSLCEKKFR